MALSKTQCHFIIFEAGFPAPVPKPRVRMGSLCRGGGPHIQPWPGRRLESKGVFWVPLCCEVCQGITVPHYSGFQQGQPGVLEALGTSEHLFLGSDTGDMQGLVRLE